MSEVWIDHADIYKDDDGQYRWRTVGANGEKLGYGEAYVAKADAIAAAMAHTGDEIDINDESGDES